VAILPFNLRLKLGIAARIAELVARGSDAAPINLSLVNQPITV
jgi:hypothetical protein